MKCGPIGSEAKAVEAPNLYFHNQYHNQDKEGKVDLLIDSFKIRQRIYEQLEEKKRAAHNLHLKHDVVRDFQSMV